MAAGKPENALEQIKKRPYFENNQDEQAAIYLIGVFEWEIMS